MLLPLSSKLDLHFQCHILNSHALTQVTIDFRTEYIRVLRLPTPALELLVNSQTELGRTPMPLLVAEVQESCRNAIQ